MLELARRRRFLSLDEVCDALKFGQDECQCLMDSLVQEGLVLRATSVSGQVFFWVKGAVDAEQGPLLSQPGVDADQQLSGAG